jgi:hypothetical protein
MVVVSVGARCSDLFGSPSCASVMTPVLSVHVEYEKADPAIGALR